ncbi:hypothetical protein HYT25_00660 [Candidatus Pacearchaeota archaeon]|nr:hypothetical protein [Candidatus Pacearchaeota archaeon]
MKNHKLINQKSYEISTEALIGDIKEEKVLGKITSAYPAKMEVSPLSPRFPATSLTIYSFEREEEILGAFPRELSEEELRVLLTKNQTVKYSHQLTEKERLFKLEILNGFNKGWTLEGRIERFNRSTSQIHQSLSLQ